MKFVICRTSMWTEEKPYEKCVREIVDRIEVRSLNTPEQYDTRFSTREGKWLSRGVNHCINEEGYIQRTHKNDREVWVIEVNTLDELIALQKEIGEELILSTVRYDGVPSLEIYDSYRE